MKWWYWIYLPEAQAVALGFTHAGRIFGVPAWLYSPENDDNMVVACPKFVPLQLYAMVMDAICWTIAALGAVDVETPLTFLRPIGPNPSRVDV